MGERLFGMETEYGLTVVPKAGGQFNSENAARELVDLARKKPHLPGRSSSGIFLPNGSRLYVDCSHPENCTPECSNPWDVCRYVQAGEQLLLGLAGQLTQRERQIERTLILKSNVDYTNRSTWGCHESYMHAPVNRGALSRQIIPHLVSRVVYCGAGGFDCFSPGIAFRVSPRVAHLQAAISSESTSGRGIFHTRDEPLCGHGYRRMHILCGESLCGEIGTWLKIGTTALVLAMIEAGKRPGEAIDLRDPLQAIRVFAADPACRQTVKLADGRDVTALDIQDHFLQQVETHADASFMPPWAGEVCQQWRTMLDRLRAGAPAALARTLDWAIKLALFQNHVSRRGTTFETLAHWTRALDELLASLARTDHCEQSLTAEFVLAARSPVAAARKRLTPYLQERGLAWDALPGFLALRLELFEIDTRYSILGDGGIFPSLQRSGVLDHHFAGVDNIPHALNHPPASGRAAIRGEAIRRLAGKNGRYSAEWDSIWDLQDGRALNLSNPFCATEKWESLRSSHRERIDPESLFWVGRYADILDHNAEALGLNVSAETLVLACARAGRQDEALAVLNSQPPSNFPCHPVALTMWVLSNGLVPAVDKMAPLITMGDRLIEEEPGSWNDYSRFVFLSHKALFFLHKGLYQLAEPLYLALLSDEANAIRSRMCSRNRCHMAELYRRLGRQSDALELAKAAERTHRAENLPGDMATHSLPMLAKLTADANEASAYLDSAEATLRLHRNNLGLAQVLCLRARRLRISRDGAEIAILQRAVPVLNHCDIARKIISEWQSWIAPEAAPEPMDYWGL